MPTADQITREWLGQVLFEGGYEVEPSSKNPDLLHAKHPRRPNVAARLNRSVGIISFVHFWRMKKPGWGEEKAMLAALNQANGMSWVSTYYRDNDGDLGVSSYIVITESLTQADVLRFLEEEATHFVDITERSGLRRFIE